MGPHYLKSEVCLGTPGRGHLHSGDALKGPKLRDHPLHTQRGSGISEGPCGCRLTLQPLQKILMTSLLPPVPPPLAHPSHGSQSDLAKLESDRVTPCAKPQWPISELKLSSSNSPPSPACLNPNLILPHSLPHSLCSNQVGPLDVLRYQAQSH